MLNKLYIAVLIAMLLTVSAIWADENPSEQMWKSSAASDGPGKVHIRSIQADPRGGVWAGTFGGGLFYFNGASWRTYTTSNSGIESNDITSIAIDNNNIAWFGAGAGHVTSYDGKNWNIYSSSPARIHGMVVDHNNVKWLASNGGGLGRIHNGSIEIFTPGNSPLISSIPVGLAVDHNNSLWIGYYYSVGVSFVHNGAWQHYYELGGTTVFSVSAIDVDSHGSIWMASNAPEFGVWCIDHNGGSKYYEPDKLVSGKVWGLAVDHEDIVWFATEGGVTSFDGTTWQHYTTDNSWLTDDLVLSVTVDNDNVKWFGTLGGVSHFGYRSEPYIILQSPNGGEFWARNGNKTISWVSRDVETVQIDYSPDGGMSWETIADAIEAQLGSYSWNLPDISSDKMLVRITDTLVPEEYDISIGEFTLAPPSLVLTAPTGGITLEAEKSAVITWNQIGVDRLTIEYTIDRGVTWNKIVDNIDAAVGSFIWLTPNIDTPDVKIRIYNPDDTSFYDETDTSFAIQSKFIDIIYPNGGEIVTNGEATTVIWSVSSNITNVLIEFSLDGGESWVSLDKVNGNRGSYTFSPDFVPSSSCLIRISDSVELAYFDTSDDVFILLDISHWKYHVTGYYKTVQADPRGGIWVSIKDGGVSYFDGNDWTYYTKSNSGITNDNIAAIAIDHEGVAWFGSENWRVSSFDGTNWSFHLDLPRTIHDIVVDHNNVKWISSNESGLYRLEGDTITVFKAENSELKTNSPLGLAVDHNNAIWVGYLNEAGVTRIQGDSWTQYDTIGGSQTFNISTITVDNNGSVWMGNGREFFGVWRLDQDGESEYYKFSQFASSNIKDIVVDKNNIIWFTGSGGVTNFDGTSWALFPSINTGLPRSDIINMTVSNDNRKWFASSEGLMSYHEQTESYLFLVTPNGGESLDQSVPITITWESWDVTSINIDYSSDGGTSWNTVVENINASDGSYIWMLPEITSDNVVVRLTDNENADITDTSNDSFGIVQSMINMTSPAEGSLIESDRNVTITWESIGIGIVTIEYSLDGGAEWNLIADRIDASSGFHTWETPDESSGELLIRIFDSDNPSTVDTTGIPLQLREEYVELISPNGGEVFTNSDPVTIIYNVSHRVYNLKIEHSSDGGETWNQFATVNTNLGYYVWEPDVLPSSLYKLRIKDANKPWISDTSEGTFSIRSLGDWTDYPVTPHLGTYRMADVFADDNGGVWIATSGAGFSHFDGKAWHKYTMTNTPMISNWLNTVIADHDGTIWISSSNDYITSFDGNDWTVHKDIPRNIRRIVVDHDNVKYFASPGEGLGRYDGTKTTLLTKDNSPLLSNNLYGLFVDTSNTLWIGYLDYPFVSTVRDGVWKDIYEVDNQMIYGICGFSSDSNGSVWMGGYDTRYGIWRLDPDGGGEYFPPSQYFSPMIYDVEVDNFDVVWIGNSDGIASYNGSIWKQYTSENSPLAEGAGFGVAVDTNNTKWFAMYDGLSSLNTHINNFVSLAFPNGGEQWYCGKTYNIAWLDYGGGTLDIEYSHDGGTSWENITSGAAASGLNYSWKLPFTDTDRALIRMTDPSNPKLTTQSKGFFAMLPPTLILTSPDSDEKIVNNKPYSIIWESNGINNVLIEFSSDSGTTWQTVAESVDAHEGVYNWDVPDSVSDSCLVRISGDTPFQLSDTSDSIFSTIRPFVTIVTPNGGESFLSSETILIRWNSEGVDSVNIDYSKDGDSSWYSVISSKKTADRRYRWKPDLPGTSHLTLRVSSFADSTIYDVSDSTFTFIGTPHVDEEPPIEFALFQNSPNPFNNGTMLRYALPEAAKAVLEIYSVNGQLIERIVDGYQPKGYHRALWSGESYSSGVYFAMLEADGKNTVVKMLLIK
ncbi:T9SS type A sorting domain-containing protein [Candidatus Omnitrophota bacterium]